MYFTFSATKPFIIPLKKLDIIYSFARNYNSDIVAPMNQAFDNGNFYGLEYILDELIKKKPAPENRNAVDWFGTTDYFA